MTLGTVPGSRRASKAFHHNPRALGTRGYAGAPGEQDHPLPSPQHMHVLDQLRLLGGSAGSM